jgi:diguanylate cyclase (GGDEF)-like protein
VDAGSEPQPGNSLNDERALYLAGHDPLTGLLNRRRFRAELEDRVAFGSRYGGRCAVVVLALADADGSAPADEAVQRAAAVVAARVRETDAVAKLAGAEIAVLLPQGDREGAMKLAHDLRESLTAAEDDPALVVTAGAALVPVGDPDGPEAVLVAADLALQRAAETEAAGVAFYEAPGDEEEELLDRRRPTSAWIRRAIREERLSLDTQPIIDLATGAVSGYELLLRMRENGEDLLPAAAFIRTAEDAGMVQELDRWVAGQAIDLLARHEAEGDPISVHVNLAGASMSDDAVLEYIERRLDEEGVDPSRITFELTDMSPVENPDAVAAFADRLAELGCRIALDDYGAGSGQLQYLKELPFDLIKIDGDFIRNLPRNDADQLTVQAIVKIARGLGKQTIAAFVQDEETADMLRSYGVDMAQGFHLGRPVAVAGSLA